MPAFAESFKQPLYDIDNDSKLSLIDIIYGLQVLSGMREEEVPAGINQTICEFVTTLKNNSSALESSHLEEFYHSDYLNEGMNKILSIAERVDDMRGEIISDNYLQLNNVIKFDQTNMVAIAELQDDEGDQWIEIFKKDSNTGKWLIYGDQENYDYDVHFGISKFYQTTTSIAKGIWVGVNTWDKELVNIYVIGSIFNEPQKVNLDYSEQREFFYTPTESITSTHRYFELYSDSFGDFPVEGSEFALVINDGNTVKVVTCSSNNAITNEVLDGTGPTDYSIQSVKGKEITFSFQTPQTFIVSEVEWMWRPNDAGPWHDVDPVSNTSAIFDFPTEIVIESEVQNIYRIMLQARVIGTKGEQSVVYWMYGY